MRTDVHGGIGVRHVAADPADAPPGYGRPQLKAAYRLPPSDTRRTVAVIESGDDPTAESDLAVYRKTYGLPPCTTANGCFHKVNQRGRASPLPPANLYWAIETSLDVDAVSAVCPSCHILVVESNNETVRSLASAVRTAIRLGVTITSNSYGGAEGNGLNSFAAAYHHAGVATVVSSGDSGFGVANFPADIPDVTAAGGTKLSPANNSRGWSEKAWTGSSSGCSAYFPKPAWQHDRECPSRTVADVSADADPETGLAVYDTAGAQAGGWGVVGGTSAASPIIAGVIALAGNPARLSTPAYVYEHASHLNDVRSGSNYAGCLKLRLGYMCHARKGYDGPTGLGTPNGTGAF